MTIQIEHYLQIVKTEVISRRFGKEHSLIEEYEYTAHSSIAHSYHYPVAKFHFELSPMQVLYAVLHRLEINISYCRATNLYAYSPFFILFI